MIATKYQTLVVVTNTMVSGEDFRSKKPALGENWSFQPNIQLFATQLGPNHRAFKLTKSSFVTIF